MNKDYIEGWIARERDGYLYVFDEEPKRDNKIGGFKGANVLELPKDMFPSQRWTNEPRKVKVTIELL